MDELDRPGRASYFPGVSAARGHSRRHNSGSLVKIKPSLNWLLVFLPAAIALEIGQRWLNASWADPTAIFICAAIAIIPAAGWMGRATEHLGTRLGEGVGGLLNATFGNAAELIIAFTALLAAARDPAKAEAMHNIVKASLTGSIIGNILLVLGLALLAGGIRKKIQKFNVTAARAGATLLMISVAALILPALFVHVADAPRETVASFSLEISIILLLVYGLSLLFSLHTHKYLYTGGSQSGADSGEDGEHAGVYERHWSTKKSVGVLVGATVVVALMAEFMIGSVQAASQAIGLSELFVGVVIVAIVGNAAEHSTAVLVAWRSRMDLSLSIAIGSSTQIALLVAPLLVLVSYAMGGKPLDLVFTIPEIVAITIAVWITSQIAGDGQSHWLEGALLLTVYLILAALFFHLPA